MVDGTVTCVCPLHTAQYDIQRNSQAFATVRGYVGNIPSLIKYLISVDWTVNPLI